MLEIKIVKIKDLNRLTALHKACLPNDVLPNLGTEFLKDFYNKCLENNNQFIIGAYLKDELIGFCHLSFAAIKINRILNITTIYHILKLILINPSLFISGFYQVLKHHPIHNNTAEITFIGVTPGHQGSGVAKQLLQNANTICLNKNKLYLQTKTSNKRLAQFYINTFNAYIIKSFNMLKSKYVILKWKVDTS